MSTTPALSAAVADALAKRAAHQAALTALEASAVTLALEVVKVPDPGIPACIVAGDAARLEMHSDLAAWDAAMAKAVGLAVAYTPPPPVIDPPPPTTDPVYGCHPGTVLTEWVFAPVEGSGRPTDDGSRYDIIPDFKAGATLKNFRLTTKQGGSYAGSQGLANGQKGVAENITVHDAVLDRLNKWHNRPHLVKGPLIIRNVSDLNGSEEHDHYIEPIGGLPLTSVCFLLENGYSERCGSQRFQSAQRERDGITLAQYIDGGMVIVRNDKCVDHARHAADAGTGTRQSQAWKVFSAQGGPTEGTSYNRVLKHYLLFEGTMLDDSMQTYSHGAFLIGACYGAVIYGGEAKMGLLSGHPSEKSMEAIRVESFITPNPSGPLLIENWHGEAASGSGGQGIALLDDRPVKITGCTGNLRIQDGAGKTIGMLKDGFTRNWSSSAQAVVDTIKQAGSVA